MILSTVVITAIVFGLKQATETTAVEWVDKEAATLYQGELPSRYSLDEHISMPQNYQWPWGACWSFATARAIETYLALHGEADIEISKLYPLYMMSKDFGGRIDLYNGDFGADFVSYMDLNDKGFGAVLEAEVPYSNETYEEDGVTNIVFPYDEDDYDYLYNLKPSVYVTKVANYSGNGDYYSDEEIEMIKRHIMANGSLYALTYGASGILFEENGEDYYWIESRDPNGHITRFYDGTPVMYDKMHLMDHAISIIGWDDLYSKDNFTGTSKPEQDGAFIILNSASYTENTHTGELSYDVQIQYISYEDRLINYDTYGVLGATTDLSTVAESVIIQDENLYQALKNSPSLTKYIIDYNDTTQTLGLLNTYRKIDRLNLSGSTVTDFSQIAELFDYVFRLDLSYSNFNKEYLAKNIATLLSKKLHYVYLSDSNLDNDIIRMIKESDSFWSLEIDLSNNNITEINDLFDSGKYSSINFSGNPLSETEIDKCNNLEKCIFNDEATILIDSLDSSLEVKTIDMPDSLYNIYHKDKYHPWTRLHYDKNVISLDFDEKTITFRPSNGGTQTYIKLFSERSGDQAYKLSNAPNVGSIIINIVDSETNSCTNTNVQSFNGITFAVINNSDNAIYYDGSMKSKNEVVDTKTINGSCSIIFNKVPYGSYIVKGVETNESYYISDPQAVIVSSNNDSVASISFVGQLRSDDAEPAVVDDETAESDKQDKEEADGKSLIPDTGFMTRDNSTNINLEVIIPVVGCIVVIVFSSYVISKIVARKRF